MSTHKCPRPGCSEQIAFAKLACREDWYALPANLRIDINAAWRHSREGATANERAIAAGAHRGALISAVQWYRANPKATP